jgi:CheY-like chemotaxis protein
MHGRIGVESTPGVGSRFFVDMPVNPSDLPDRPSVPVGPAHAPLALVIDDDAAARELLQAHLHSSGYRVLQAATGEAGLVLAREHRPDVVTLDVFLPGVDGWDVLRALRGDPATADIPVVLVTISSDRRQAFGLGAVEHLVKPIDRQALLEALGRRNLTPKAEQPSVHVLVIDDDGRHLELVRTALEPAGFLVTTAESGRDGLACAGAGSFDLILLDLVLPDISGVEVVEGLRREPTTRDVPIWLVTGHDLSAADRQRLNGDVELVLGKSPIGIQNLLAEIHRAARGRQ